MGSAAWSMDNSATNDVLKAVAQQLEGVGPDADESVLRAAFEQVASAGSGEWSYHHGGVESIPEANERACAHCGDSGPQLLRCSRCKEVWYCTQKCQKAGWKQHKKDCGQQADDSTIDAGNSTSKQAAAVAETAPGTSNAPQEAEPIADGAEPAAGEAAEQGFGWTEFCNSMDTELQGDNEEHRSGFLVAFEQHDPENTRCVPVDQLKLIIQGADASVADADIKEMLGMAPPINGMVNYDKILDGLFA